MMRNLFLILFSSLFIYINTASAEGGLSASTRSNDTGSEENYEDDFFDDDFDDNFDDDFFNDNVDIDLIGPAGVTGAVRRHDRREDRREFRDDRERSNNRLRHR
jgi:hypothetical protein